MNTENQSAHMHVESEFFRSFFENNTLPILLIRPQNGAIILANNAAINFYGYPAETFLSMTIYDLNCTNEAEFIRLKKNVEELNNTRFEFKHRLANEQVRDVIAHSGILFYNNENVLCSTIIDQTDKLQAVEQAAQLTKFYDAITENSKEGVVVITVDNKFKFISNNSKKNFGYEVDDASIYDLTPNELVHPDDMNHVMQEMGKTVNNKLYIPTLIYRFLTKNNSWIWIESTYTNMLDNPFVNGIVINFKDISTRVYLEHELQIKKNLSNFLLESSTLFIDAPIENYNDQINEILKKLCDFVSADRAYIFNFDSDTLTYSNSFEYVTQGVATDIHNRQNYPVELVEQLYNLHKNGETFVSHNTAELTNSLTKNTFLSLGIKSIISAPMINNAALVGSVGFDWIKSHKYIDAEFQNLLQYFAQQIVSFINRIDLEKKLINANERFRLTQDAGEVGGWEYDIATDKYWQAEKFLQIFGISPGLPSNSDVIDECVVDCELLSNEMKNLIEHKKPYNVIFDIIRSNDKQLRTLQSIAELYYDANGEPERVLGVVFDITKEQHQLKQTRQAQAELTAVFNHENYNIWSINHLLEVTYLNEKFRDEFVSVFGIRLSKGMNIYQALPDEIKDVWLKRYQKVLSNVGFVFEEKVPFEKNFVWVEVSASPIVVEGEVVGASFFGLDITERKKQNLNLLRSKDNLQQLLDLTSTFIKHSDDLIDYERIACLVKNMSGAQYSLYNSYTDNAKHCVSLASCNTHNWLSSVEQGYGIKILNRQWSVEQYLAKMLRSKKINKFESLTELAENVVYKEILKKIDESYQLGFIYSLSIFNNQELIGNFYLFFNKNQVIQNIELCELFSNHMGEFLGRKISEEKLMRKMEEMEKFQRLTVGRELTMIALKEEINELLRAQGQAAKYKIVGKI